MIPPPPRSTLFPYTTLFRSQGCEFDVDAQVLSGNITNVVADSLETNDFAGITYANIATLSVDTTLRSEEHTSELQSPVHLVCRLLLEKKKNNNTKDYHTREY